MANMSYCRFHNTNIDLADCEEALEAIEQGEEEALSRAETEAAAELLSRAHEMILKVIEATCKDIDDLTFEDFESYIANINDSARFYAGSEVEEE